MFNEAGEKINYAKQNQDLTLTFIQRRFQMKSYHYFFFVI